MTVTATIRIVAGSNTLRTLQGVTRGLDGAAAAERRAGVQREQAARQVTARAAGRMQSAKQVADAEQREADRLTAHWRRLSDQSRAVRERDEAAKTKATERQSASQAKAAEKAAADQRKGQSRASAAAEKAAAAQRKLQERAGAAAQKAAADRARADAKAAALKAQADAKASQSAVQSANRELQARMRNLDRLRQARDRADAEATRNAQREAAKRQRLEEKTFASRRKSAANTLRMAGGAVGVATAGVLAGGIAAASTARSVSGVEGPEARVMRANKMMQGLITTAVDAGLSQADTDAMRDKIMKAAKTSATMPDEILEGLQISHDRFNSLPLFLENIEQIALAAKASNAPMSDFVGALGAAQTAYGLKSNQMKEAADIMIAAGSEGSINFKDFSGVMGPAMGTHAMNTGQRDIAGLRQFVGLMQGVGGARPGDAEGAETRGSQFVQFLSKAQVLKDLTAKGIRVRGDDGKIEIGNVIEQIANNKDLQSPTQLQAIFHDMQAREGLQALLQQRSKVLAGESGAIDFKKMRDVDANIGAQKTDTKIDRLESSGLMDLQRQAVDMQNDTIRHLEDYNSQILAVTKATNELEKKFGTLGIWMSSISALAGASVGATLLGKISGLFGGGTIGAMGGKVLARLGTGIAAGGATVTTGALAAAGAGGAAVGHYVINPVTEAITGKDASGHVADSGWFNASMDWITGNNVQSTRRRYEQGGAPTPTTAPPKRAPEHPLPPAVQPYKPMPRQLGAGSTDLYAVQQQALEQFRATETRGAQPQHMSGKIDVNVNLDQSGQARSIKATGKTATPGFQISTRSGPLTAGGWGD